MVQVLYNPKSNNNNGKEEALKIKDLFPGADIDFSDITKISDVKDYIKKIPESVKLILTGGDGTINRFVNDLDGFVPETDVFYFPSGSGNDFFNDVKDYVKDGIVCLNGFISDLPIIKVKDKVCRFINGIGYGIDGYCCEEGDRQRKKSKKKINYTNIAIKGLAYAYHPTNAKVTVDGKELEYSRVFLAPTMKGRFFGGGMKITPFQDRTSTDGHVTFAVAHNASRFTILKAFPKIFKGAHTNLHKIFESYECHDVTVRFDRPTALQIDGETVLDVTEYTVTTGKNNL